MIRTSGVSGPVTGNIKQQEALLFILKAQIDATGPELVAERLGITIEDLNKAMNHFSDMTLTELRFLASAVNCGIQFYVSIDAGFPIDVNTAVAVDKKERNSMSE